MDLAKFADVSVIVVVAALVAWLGNGLRVAAGKRRMCDACRCQFWCGQFYDVVATCWKSRRRRTRRVEGAPKGKT